MALRLVTAPVRIGNADVWILRADEKAVQMKVPLPPSTNDRQTIAYRREKRGGATGLRGMVSGGRVTFARPRPGPRAFLALTHVAHDYLEQAIVVRAALAMISHRPFEDFVEVGFSFYLRSAAYDTHNGYKLACDMLERAGFCANDRFILPQTRRPVVAPKLPCLIIDFPRRG